MEKHGLDVSFVDTTKLENVQRELKKTTRLVWIETPSNPLLHVTDIAGVVDTVKAFNKDIVVVADNTFMTPYFQVCFSARTRRQWEFGKVMAPT